MKKSNTWITMSSKKDVLLFLIPIMIGLMIIGCTNEELSTISKEKKTEVINIEMAEKWVEGNIELNAKNKNGNYRLIHWERSGTIFDHNKGVMTIEVPVYETKSNNFEQNVLDKEKEKLFFLRNSENGYTNIKIYKDLAGDYHCELVTYIYSDNSNPVVFVTDWYGNLIKNIMSDGVNDFYFNQEILKNLRTSGICSQVWYSYIIDVDPAQPCCSGTIRRETNYLYWDCGGSSGPSQGPPTPGSPGGDGNGGNSNGASSNESALRGRAAGLAINDFEIAWDQEPTINLPLLTPCQQNAYMDYLTTAAGIESNYDNAKENCLINAGLATAGVGFSQNLTFKSFAKYLAGKPSGASVASFMRLASVSNYVAYRCIESNLSNANDQINLAYKKFVSTYRSCK